MFVQKPTVNNLKRYCFTILSLKFYCICNTPSQIVCHFCKELSVDIGESEIELLLRNRKEMGYAQLTTTCYGHFVDAFFVLNQNEAKLLFWDCLLSHWQHWNQFIAFSQINHRKICWVKAVNVVEFFTLVILLINQLSSLSSFTFMSL